MGFFDRLVGTSRPRTVFQQGPLDLTNVVRLTDEV